MRYASRQGLRYMGLGLALALAVWLGLPYVGPAPSRHATPAASPRQEQPSPGAAPLETSIPTASPPGSSTPGVPAASPLAPSTPSVQPPGPAQGAAGPPPGGSDHRILAAGPQAAPASGATVSGAPAHTMSQVPGSGVVPGDRVVALTFDDGPDPAYTPEVLQELQTLQVSATFFMIGWEAATRPGLVHQVVAAGDGIGNHTWNHVALTRLGDAAFRAQVDRTNDLLSSLTGRRISCLRPPEGSFSTDVLHRLAARGLKAVLWSDDPRDWTRPRTSAIVRRVLAQAAPGAIIELHDGGGDRSETVQALPAIVEGLRAQGYRLAPICMDRSA